MSKNINQVYTANPITSNLSADLMYFGRSPYGLTDDTAMLYSNFAAQFSANILTTKGDLYTFSTVNARLAVGGTNGQMLQVASSAATGLAWSTATYPITSGTAGKVIISDGTNYLTSTSVFPNTVGAAGRILRSDGTVNAYTTATYPDLVSANAILFGSASNTVGPITAAPSAILVSSSASVPAWSSAMTNGQVIIGSTGATPAAGTISASGNITVTVGAGTVALSATGAAGFVYNNVAGTTQSAAINQGYINGNAGLTTVTLPGTAAQGSVIAIQGLGAAGWVMTAAAGQTIKLGSSTTTSGGSLASTNLYDAVEIVCITANTTWGVKSVVGNLTVT